jgi:hypothetical protein
VLVGAVVGSSGSEQLAGAVEVGGTSKEEERSGQQEILQDGVGGARWAEAAASQLRVRFCEKQRRLNPPWGGWMSWCVAGESESESEEMICTSSLYRGSTRSLLLGAGGKHRHPPVPGEVWIATPPNHHARESNRRVIDTQSIGTYLHRHAITLLIESMD